MLAALRRLPTLDRATRQGRGWPADPGLGETVRDLGGCTVGLVGYGNIAKRVSDIVAAMGATVLHTSTRGDGRPGWRRLPDLSPASGRCPQAASDVVSLHLPLTAQTRRLLGRDALALMKPHAVLVNTSRGGSSTRTRSSTRCVAGGWPRRGWTFSMSSRWCPTTRYWAWTTWC